MPENGQIKKTRNIIIDKICADVITDWVFDYKEEVDLGKATTDKMAHVVWMNEWGTS